MLRRITTPDGAWPHVRVVREAGHEARDRGARELAALRSDGRGNQPSRRSCASDGTPPTDHDPWRLREDQDVEPKAPGLRILDVESDHVVESELVSPADLPEAGETGLDGEAAVPAPLVVIELVRDGRPRADKRHLASQDVEELGQLIQAPAPEEPTHRGDPLVVRELVERSV